MMPKSPALPKNSFMFELMVIELPSEEIHNRRWKAAQEQPGNDVFCGR